MQICDYDKEKKKDTRPKPTVLCKSNESEFRRISFIVLTNFRLHVGEISHGISRRSMWYFEENAAKLCEFFRNFEVTNFPCFRNFEEMNFRFFEFSKRQTVIKNTLYIVNCSNIHNSELNALYLFLHHDWIAFKNKLERFYPHSASVE